MASTAEKDAFYFPILAFIKENQPVTLASVQRHFYIGYAKTARVLDMLVEDALITKENGKYVIFLPEKHTQNSKNILNFITLDNGEQVDCLLPKAIKIAINKGKVSVALLQRELLIGYARAARMVDYMAQKGYISEWNEQDSRILLTINDFNNLFGNQISE